MATGSTQSQLRRYLSFLVLVGCLSLAGLAAAFEPAQGGPFFLLSDQTFGSDEDARVRIEATDMYAINQYGGADVFVYRIPQPLDFLQKQKNLHRVQVPGNYAGEGLANALRHAWDAWYVRSREAWRGLFTAAARGEATRRAPELSVRPGFLDPTRYAQNRQYKPIPGLELKAGFRYPVADARAIEPPKGVQLDGSSSEFIAPSSGNVMVPIGRLPAGLYLVEAVVGKHRATTLLFVSDTVAITKISSGQLLAWTAERKSGRPAANAQVLWTDGAGVLKSGSTDSRGLVTFERNAPEQTYVMGEDANGGVFISENYYYDSEIYNAKLYAVTDRPLYRPGDQVFIKVIGREFTSARDSKPVAAGELMVQVFDPNGLPVSRQKINLAADTGADTSFRLPGNAPAGGYDIRIEYKGDRYGAAFRVAEYQKPHFEIAVLPAKADFRTGEPVNGRFQLAYPDGKPVKNATVEVTVRSQQMTMVDGELGYSGQFPVKLATASLRTDAQGSAAFTLPAAKEPSRYIVTAFATDGAAYRVKATREILVERGASAWAVKGDRQFSAAGESVTFTAAPVLDGGNPPTRWEWLRLEDRKRADGSVAAGHKAVLTFPEPGSYTVNLRDERGNIVAAASHFVGGPGAKAPAGSISIVFDRQQYKPGDTAQALVTFPVEVANALFTLERDRVEQTALADGGDWLKVERLSPTQWRARLPVRADHAPNITLSVVYVKDGDYVFQNQGFKVEQPRVALEFKTAREVYQPGETVEVDVLATIDGKPAAANLAIGVVDEMIYVLQPEIAPDIFDFFYHPRRNNVRTAASLSFIGYDLSTPRGAKAPSRRQVNERAVKVLERPRREDVDTAYWNPQLATDASGHARFSFRMPDSLTRWRITARATDNSGVVGQRRAYVRSEKPVYVKWTSPDWLRSNDQPIAAVALFNQTQADQAVEFAAADSRQNLSLKPGINFTTVSLAKIAAGPLTLSLRQNGKLVDSQEVPLQREPVAWLEPHSLAIEAKAGENPLTLPADASHVRVRFASAADALFARSADDLIEYPYGCVEQTASRLIPLTLAAQAMGSEAPGSAGLRQKLYSERFRLAQMAGPNAVFGWWGDMTGEDPFLTAYAYYADWLAGKALGLTLPQSHWDRLLDIYAKKGYQLPLLQRALALSWMQEIGLPVASLVDVLNEDLARATPPAARRSAVGDSIVLSEPDGRVAVAAARILAAQVAGKAGARTRNVDNADIETLRAANLPFANALLLFTGKGSGLRAEQVLAAISPEMPTFERSAALVWTYRASGGKLGQDVAAPALAAPWRKTTTATGRTAWTLPAGAALPKSLDLGAFPVGSLTAFVDYDSRSTDGKALPVTVERRLYRLANGASKRDEAGGDMVRGRPVGEATVAQLSEFDLEALPANAVLRTDEVYVDEIVLRPGKDQVMHYGLLEAALPPGATVERSTWGIALRHRDAAAEAMEKARAESTRFGYAVPIEPLAGEVTIRHLVRFAQRGQFELPPARFQRMYQPEQKAYERKEAAWTSVRVE
jgi:uncharacterized protein YfaS (alpha-2-macroglobulin family)